MQDMICEVSLSRRVVLLPVLAPASELLSFVSPKESNQRKGDPDAALFLCSSLSTRVDRRAIPGPLPTSGFLPLPSRANLAESSGARRGMRETTPYLLRDTNRLVKFDLFFTVNDGSHAP